MNTRRFTTYFLGVAIATFTLTGCATNQEVDKKIAQAQANTDKKIESVEGQVESVQEKQKQQDAAIAQLSQTAQDALKRAQEAGVLAKGKVVFEQTFTEDRVRFKTDSSELSKDSKGALDEFAKKVKDVSSDTPVYLEIQGHTDDTGSTAYNEELGSRRAEAVRRYLSREHKMQLMRMSTISYGDTAPVASNKTKKGRAQNRRVVIVVLQ